MDISGKKIGVIITGSFCSMEKTFIELERLVNSGAIVTSIFSEHASTINSRFGKGEDFVKKAYKISKNPPFFTIPESEKIGPGKLFDVMVIMPCTGNTLAKLNNAIVDNAALMAAKAHLRNELPLVISIATNDALSQNFKNIGELYNRKNIYFVPFKQDDYIKKPNSLMANLKFLKPTIEMALENKQFQPVLCPTVLKNK